MKLTVVLSFSFILYFYYTCNAYPTNQCAIGCRYGPRAMLNATINNGTEFYYPNISACSGIFHGYIGGADATGICADLWHVCSTFDLELIRSVAWTDQFQTDECYAFNAAQDFGLCRYCTGNIHEDDMAGFGAGCPQTNEDSCFSPTVADQKLGYCCHAYITNRGCAGNDYALTNEINGVVCCANNPADPCFFGNCTNNCCNNGICDYSYANCTCNPGFVGGDCCIQCSALTCDQCLNTTGCGWCTDSHSCTSITAPNCHNPITESPNLDATICPVNSQTHVTTVNVGAAIGGAVGALAFLLAAGAIFLYRKYSTGEYEGFWNNYSKLNAGLTDNPLYQQQNIEVVSPLYDRK